MAAGKNKKLGKPGLRRIGGDGRKFFVYNPATKRMSPLAGRPTNQNSDAVQQKVAERIEAGIPVGDRKRTTQAFFLGVRRGDKLSKNKLHMAHGVSAQEIKHALAKSTEAFAARGTVIEKEAVDFATGFITTDASDEDDVRQTTRSMFRAKSPDDRIAAASKLLKRLNRSSGNLMGADGRTNSSIQELRDIAETKKQRRIAFMQRRQKLMDKFQKAIGMKSYPSKMGLAGPISSTQD